MGDKTGMPNQSSKKRREYVPKPPLTDTLPMDVDMTTSKSASTKNKTSRVKETRGTSVGLMYTTLPMMRVTAVMAGESMDEASQQVRAYIRRITEKRGGGQKRYNDDKRTSQNHLMNEDHVRVKT